MRQPGVLTGAATTARRDRLRDRLVTEAERMIAGAGLPDFRARALAAAAGCSVGAIYTAFTDLDALVLAVNGRTLAALDAALAPGPDTDPVAALLHLADRYLDYAANQRHRWEALFLHRLPEGGTAPDWYISQQALAFSHIEGPLGRLDPGLTPPARADLARTMFAAVHGVVALGLDEKVGAITLPALRSQLHIVVTAMARGVTGATAL